MLTLVVVAAVLLALVPVADHVRERLATRRAVRRLNEMRRWQRTKP